MDPTRLLVLVPLLSCALAAPAPQFAYSTTTFGHPLGHHLGLGPAFVPLPFARVPYHGDVYSNHLDPQEEASRLPPSPYHFLPATLPRAIYSEPAHILSGYSYQTLDPAGAKSQVLFVSGPNSQQLFRQNADLLQIVLPSLFTADGDDVIPRPSAEAPASSAEAPTAPAESPSAPSGPADDSDDGGLSASAEARTEDEHKSGSGTDQEVQTDEAKPTEASDVPDKSDDESSKEEPDKSSEESTSSPAEKGEELKSDDSTSEASNPSNAVPPESESVSTEAPTTSASVSDDKKSDETKSDDKSTEVKPSDEDQTTESTVTSTTAVPAE